VALSYEAALALVHGSAATLPLRKPVMTKPKRQRKRKPTLASVAKQAEKAGLEVARYEVDPDGKISVVTGKPDITTPETGNEWDSVLQ
jgi:hypothetical protein